MATRKTLVLETRVAELGGQVRALKETKAEKTEVAAAVQRLLEAKARLDEAYNGRVRALQEAVEASGRPAAESMRAAIDELVTARAMLYAKKRHQKAAKADEAGEAAAPAPRRQRSKSDPNVATAATAAVAASSHAAPNELPWPETEALPKVVCARVKQYLHAEASFKAAAADERPAREAHAREALAELHGLLHSSRACASQKLDGTNVAVLADGGLAGRRQMIADGASEYQRTPLAAARAVDAAAVRRHLAPTLAACGGAAARLAVFGELMCNGDIYGYAGTGLVDGAFRAFGVVFVPETKPGGAEDGGADGAASDLVARLRERGWAANKVGGGACCAAAVRLALNRPLMALLGAAGVPTVPVVEVGLGGGLCALVSRHEAWMLEMAGEGLVVVLERPHREGEGVEGIVTAKWKVAAEFQPGTVLALRETLSAVAAHVEEHGAAAVAALPVGLLPTLQALLRVATAELSATFRAQTLVHRQGKYGDRSKADGAAQRQQQQRKGASGPPQEVLCALESALTKFDALPAKFEAGEVPTTVIATLLREMQADLGRRPASLQRRAEKVVAAHVGREYAAWRAASSSAAA